MNIIKRLPLPLARHVYSYDDTYKKKFKAVISIFKFLNHEAYYFEFTKYPKIYSKAYWGNFRLAKKYMYLKNRHNTSFLSVLLVVLPCKLCIVFNEYFIYK